MVNLGLKNPRKIGAWKLYSVRMSLKLYPYYLF